MIKSGRRTARNSSPKDSVAEIDSPPRLTRVASEYGLRPEFALDLTTVDETDGVEWDFNQEWIGKIPNTFLGIRLFSKTLVLTVLDLIA